MQFVQDQTSQALTSKRVKTEDFGGHSEDGVGLSSGEGESTFPTAKELQLHPMYLQRVWTDSFMRQRVCVALLLPSGCAIDCTKNIRIKVERDLKTVIVRVPWPELMMDMERVHKTFENDVEVGKDDLCLMRMAMAQSVRDLRETVDDVLISVAKVELPITVHPTLFSVNYVGDSQGTRILYLNFRESAEDAYHGNSTKPIKMV